MEYVGSSIEEKLTLSDQVDHLLMNNEKLLKWTSLVIITILVLVIEVTVAGIFDDPKSHLEREDIFFVWQEGEKISNGANPYAAILDGNLIENEKYATYLPFFYLLASLFQILGFTSFKEWVIFFRILSAIFYLAIAYFLFLKSYKKSVIFSIFVTMYWIFNRWSIVVVYVVNIDFIPLFLMIISLYYYDTHRNMSLITYAFSLSMKHLAIFLLPIYLILLLRDSEITSIKDYGFSILKIVGIPLIFAIPFIILDPKAFLYSMAFSGTRHPKGLFDEFYESAPEGTFIAFGIANRIFMVLIMALVYLLFQSNKIERFTTSFLIFVIFIEFNLVLFDQYRVWRIALLPLMLLEFNIFTIKKDKENIDVKENPSNPI
ncbi:MAG: hypothetical protein HeimC2_26910 [Candidatus Heimdallarchaeota archaeon LC_2]|nr:MAG: hypothetical protein HeimC2_26910 [Candidatus Heimdallarchaeota archaeon LC_2]